MTQHDIYMVVVGIWIMAVVHLVMDLVAGMKKRHDAPANKRYYFVSFVAYKENTPVVGNAYFLVRGEFVAVHIACAIRKRDRFDSVAIINYIEVKECVFDAALASEVTAMENEFKERDR